jgi:hypothetical protein
MVAMEDPSDLRALDELAFQIGRKLRPVLVAPSDLEDALQRHYHGGPRTAAAPGPSPGRPAGVREDEFDTQPQLGAAPADPEPSPEPDLAPEPEPLSEPEPPSEREPLPELELRPGPQPPSEPIAAASGPAPVLGLDPVFDSPMLDGEDEPGSHFEFEEGVGLGAEAEPPLPAPAEVPRSRPAAPRERSAASEPRVILRALSQLLVEKGVITRDELAERLRRVAAEEKEGAA